MRKISRLELIVGGVFVLLFLIWSFDKCRYSQNELTAAKQEQQRQEAQKATTDSAKAKADSLKTTPRKRPPVLGENPDQANVLPGAKLYVIVDSINVRDQPKVKGAKIVERVPMRSFVYYLEERTGFSDSLMINKVKVFAPWVKVQTQQGRQGWVFAGGVSFYQQ